MPRPLGAATDVTVVREVMALLKGCSSSVSLEFIVENMQNTLDIKSNFPRDKGQEECGQAGLRLGTAMSSWLPGITVSS